MSSLRVAGPQMNTQILTSRQVYRGHCVNLFRLPYEAAVDQMAQRTEMYCLTLLEIGSRCRATWSAGLFLVKLLS